MKRITTREAAEKWKISGRRVRKLCEEGRINGAYRLGWVWSIPDTAIKPLDARQTRPKAGRAPTTEPGRSIFKAIEVKKQQLDAKRPLPDHALQSLRENALVEWTYNSNAIEGNTLTIYETRVVLEGITIGGKSVREHLEVINHRDAIIFLEELVRGNEPLSEWSIKNLHRLVLKNIDDKNAGVYRCQNVIVSGAKHRPPGHLHVQEQMERLVAKYNRDWPKLHPVERAALLHGEFVKVHPFLDGNGRTARLLMNFELMRHGYPPAIIRADMRPRYYDALDLAHTTGDYGRFTKLVAECVEQGLDLWLSVA